MTVAELVALLNLLTQLVRDIDVVADVVAKHLGKRTVGVIDDAVVATLPV